MPKSTTPHFLPPFHCSSSPTSSSLSRARLCPFPKHIPICARVCNVLVFPFRGPQLLQPRTSRLSGQQQRPNEPFCPQRDTSSSVFRGLLALFVRCKSGPQGNNGEPHLERAVSDCKYGTITLESDEVLLKVRPWLCSRMLKSAMQDLWEPRGSEAWDVQVSWRLRREISCTRTADWCWDPHSTAQ
jgi:hypothetical protein